VSRADRRSVNISLTAKGVRLAINLLRSLQRERFSVALAQLGGHDVDMLNRILRELERLLFAGREPAE
jgi:DNA-binding MarR family transcriptional regulator